MASSSTFAGSVQNTFYGDEEEEEDCCPGMERNLDRMIVSRNAESKGENIVEALEAYKKGMRDDEWGKLS